MFDEVIFSKDHEFESRKYFQLFFVLFHSFLFLNVLICYNIFNEFLFLNFHDLNII